MSKDSKPGDINLSEEMWSIDDRMPFCCVRNGYDIVTSNKREYIGNIRTEDLSDHVVKIHNQYLESLKENKV